MKKPLNKHIQDVKKDVESEEVKIEFQSPNSQSDGLKSPYNLTDKSTPLMLNFRSQNYINGATGGVVENSLHTKHD